MITCNKDVLLENKIEYIIVMVDLFAKRFELSGSQAYRYIKRYGGIKLMDEHYNIMHTLDPYQTIDELSAYCRRFGGLL